MDEQRVIVLGVSGGDSIYLISRDVHENGNRFRIDKSEDGLNFRKHGDFDLPQISKTKGVIFQDFRLSHFENKWILTCRVMRRGVNAVEVFESEDLIQWKDVGKFESVHESAVILNSLVDKDKYLMYIGGKSIKTLRSSDLSKWSDLSIVHEIPQDDMKHYCIVAGANLIDDGILITYFLSNNPHNTTSYSIEAMLFDPEDPTRPLWKQPKIIMNPEGHKLPIGVVVFNGLIISYWQRWSGEILSISHGSLESFLLGNGHGSLVSHPRLERHPKNPLLEPSGDQHWQSVAVFNPAAIYDEGKVHLLYRAVGESNISVWGHAKSHDGIVFETHIDPIYTPNMHFDSRFQIPGSPSKFVSGPGWGGCEDPRAVVIDDKLYVIYVAFDGHNPQRVAVTSMDMNDFRNGNWNWSAPTMLSPAGRSNKNWVLFPNKINGKFALLHSITPSISIEYVEDLENARLIDSYFAQTSRHDHWDNWVRGAGPPPLKTDQGWLLFYHAMDINDPGKYKLGVMLLDLDNPTQIIARSKSPVLEPLAHYENEGLKPGVIFATGAVLIGDNIHIYYGGSDNTINTAYYRLDEFLYNLKHHAKIKPNGVRINKTIHD